MERRNDRSRSDKLAEALEELSSLIEKMVAAPSPAEQEEMSRQFEELKERIRWLL